MASDRPICGHSRFNESCSACLKAELTAARQREAQREAAFKLAAHDELFFAEQDNGVILPVLLVNDQFYPAADGEEVPFELMPELLAIYKNGGSDALLRWVQQRRGGLALRPKREQAVSEREGLRKELERAEKAESSLTASQVLEAAIVSFWARQKT